MFEFIKKADRECGTPFYVAYPERFESNLQSFRKAFTDIYPKFILSYSFKTNYTPPLLTLAKTNNVYAEVVSTMEYNMAIQLGYPTDHIIFNGPVKTINDIDTATRNNSILQLDSAYEVALLLDLQQKNPGHTISVGLRINMEIKNDSGESSIQAGLHESRFGFTSDLLKDIIPVLKKNNIKIISLHGHTTSSDRAVKNYQTIANRLLSVCKEFDLDDVQYLDVGGSFFGAAPVEIDVSRKPQYKDYAQGICDIMLSDSWFQAHKPYIVIEPGSAVVANVFELVTKIVQHKQVCGKNFVVADASQFQVRTFLSNNCPFCTFSENAEEETITADIVGSTCMEVDKIATEVKLNHYSHGDYIVFKGVGAYRQNLTPLFINPQCPIIKQDSQGNPVIIRKRQDLNTILKHLGYEGF